MSDCFKAKMSMNNDSQLMISTMCVTFDNIIKSINMNSIFLCLTKGHKGQTPPKRPALPSPSVPRSVTSTSSSSTSMSSSSSISSSSSTHVSAAAVRNANQTSKVPTTQAALKTVSSSIKDGSFN